MTDGLSLLELSDLPAAWRTIIRLLMREQPQTYGALADAAANLPDSQRLQGDHFDEALAALCHHGYLIQQNVDGSRQFTTKIARKAGRTLGSNLWDARTPADGEDCDLPPKPAEPAPPPRRARTNLFDNLG